MKTPKQSTSRASLVWTPARVLGALVLAGLLLRVLLLNFRFAVGFDEVNYLKLGVSAHLHGMPAALHTYWSPFFPWLVAWLCSFTDNYELAGRLVSVAAGALLPLPVYALGKLHVDKTAGLIAAAFAAFFPPLAFQATAALTEATYMLLVALAVLSGWMMLKRYSLTAALLSGLLAGCLYLTRPEGFGFLLIFAAWIVAGSLFKLYLIRPLRMLYLLLALGTGFVAVATPYLIFLHGRTGTWTLSAKGAANLQMDTPEDGSRPSFRSLSADNSSVPIDQVFHEGNFLKGDSASKGAVAGVSVKGLAIKYAGNMYDLIKTAIPSFLTMLPLMFLGIGLLGVSWQWGQGRKNIYFLSFVCCYWFVVVPLFHINARYFTPMWPICAVWIAGGAHTVFRWLREHEALARFATARKVQPATLAIGLLLGLALAFSFLPEIGRILARRSTSTDRWADAVELKQAGLWIRQQGAAPPVIMSRNHAVSFYAGNYDVHQSVTIPENSLDRILEYAHHRGARYLVLSERYTSEYPQLAWLLHTAPPLQGLKRVYEHAEAPGLLTVVYEMQE